MQESDDSDRSRLIGLEEALALGLSSDRPQPEKCRWCGKPLALLGFPCKGRVFWVSHERCGCIGELEDERRNQEKRERESEAKTLVSLKKAGVKKRFLNAKVDAIELADYLRGFANSKGHGLYLVGCVGSGKTHSASALAKEFVLAGYVVVLATSTDMLGSIQETYRGDLSSLDAMNRYSRCDVLVIDDLGKESSSSWSVNMIFQIINTRYESMLPTVVTSQYRMDVLCKRFSRQGEAESAEAIVSRLRQTCTVVCLSGPDRRMKC